MSVLLKEWTNIRVLCRAKMIEIRRKPGWIGTGLTPRSAPAMVFAHVCVAVAFVVLALVVRIRALVPKVRPYRGRAQGLTAATLTTDHWIGV
jgi:hypothetical protein